jgi:dienelactone hydrolase
LLHALLWQPPGAGPFPAILVNHGSYLANEPLQPDDPGALGAIFASQGYVCLVLFRRGVGPSVDQGPPEGELMGRALAEHAQTGRNQVQIELLEGEALNEALSGLVYLRHLPAVDPARIAVVGHSFGGSLSILLAARDSTIRAAVLFGAAAGSWDSSPELQGRLLAAVREARARMYFIHAANDYSVAPGKALTAELQRIGKTHRLTIYPPFGSTTRAGHNLVFRSVHTWQRDVLAFLKTQLSP